MHRLFDIRNEDRLPYDEHGIATLHQGPEAAVSFARILPEHAGLDAHTHADTEDNGLVLNGLLTYPTSENNEVFVSRGAWVVARPGEVHGYLNRAAKPLTLLLFQAKARSADLSMHQRIYKPIEAKVTRVTMYETPSSRGEIVSLNPGGIVTLAPALCRAALITEGRVSLIINREKISLDSGEGAILIREAAEVWGVGGHSRLAVFTTIP